MLATLGLLAFPLAAYASATHVPPPDLVGASDLPPLRQAPAGHLHDLPVFASGVAVPAADLTAQLLVGGRGPLMTAVADLADAAVGPVRAARLLALPAAPVQPGDDPAAAFPAESALVDSALPAGGPNPAEAAALTDLGAVVQIGEANRLLPTGFDADGIALAALGAARTGGACAAELDYLLEVAADPFVSAAAIDRESTVAQGRCPGDATPGWLVGERQLSVFDQSGAAGAFHLLENRYPGSPTGWAGDADVELTTAERSLERVEPFTARAQYRGAALLLDRARQLERGAADRGLVMDEALAWRGAGRPDRAVPLEREVLARAPGADAAMALVGDLEATHRYAEAAAVLARVPPPRPVLPSAALLAEPRGDTVVPSLEGDRAVGLTVGNMPSVSPAETVIEVLLIPPSRQEDDPSASPGSIPARRAMDLLLAREPAAAARSSDPYVAALARLEEGDATGAQHATTAMCASGGEVVRIWCAGAPDVPGMLGLFLVPPVLEPPLTGSRPPPSAQQLADRLTFDLENDWRAADRLDRAAAVTTAWVGREPSSFVALDQAGEVAYLRGEGTAAAALFHRAAGRAPTAAARQADVVKTAEAEARAGDPVGALGELGTLEAGIRARAADLAAGQKAVASYQQAVRSGASPAALATMVRTYEQSGADQRFQAARASESVDAPLAYAVSEQEAEIEVRVGNYARAVRYYDAARALAAMGIASVTNLYVPAAVDTNEGLADVQSGRHATGVVLLRRALATDPLNPLFLQNLAYAERRQGHYTAAVSDYRRALTADPSNYPAANDLGVLLAREGRLDSAAAVLRSAVSAGPDYALARYNLGVVLGQQGPGHLVEAEGDRAAAVRMDHGLAEDAPVTRFDDGTVFTTLDVSRPPPPGWHFAEVQGIAPAAGGGAALVVVLLGLARELATEKGADRAEEKALERLSQTEERRRRLGRWWSRWSGWKPAPVLAAVATAAVLIWPLASSDGAMWEEEALLAAAALALVAAYTRVHHWTLRRALVPIRHHSWVPGLTVAAAAAAAHLPFTPLPVAEPTEEEHRRRRWLAPATLGSAAVTLLILGRLTGVPSARAFGAAALVMTSSALLPVAPCDGAYVRRRSATLVAGAAVLAVSVLLILHVL